MLSLVLFPLTGFKLNMTHAHFDQDGMDEVDNQITESGGWIFGRYNDFYSYTQDDYFFILHTIA